MCTLHGMRSSCNQYRYRVSPAIQLAPLSFPSPCLIQRIKVSNLGDAHMFFAMWEGDPFNETHHVTETASWAHVVTQYGYLKPKEGREVRELPLSEHFKMCRTLECTPRSMVLALDQSMMYESNACVMQLLLLNNAAGLVPGTYRYVGACMAAHCSAPPHSHLPPFGATTPAWVQYAHASHIAHSNRTPDGRDVHLAIPFTAPPWSYFRVTSMP